MFIRPVHSLFSMRLLLLLPTFINHVYSLFSEAILFVTSFTESFASLFRFLNFICGSLFIIPCRHLLFVSVYMLVYVLSTHTCFSLSYVLSTYTCFSLMHWLRMRVFLLRTDCTYFFLIYIVYTCMCSYHSVFFAVMICKFLLELILLIV